MNVRIKLKEFNYLFVDKCQYIRLYDLANDNEVLFEDQIDKMPMRYNERRIILFETMEEEDFDGYFGIYIATKNEDEYYEEYNDIDDEEEEEDDDYEW